MNMKRKMTPSSTPFPEEKTRIADSLFVVSREAPDISDLSRVFCIPKVGILTEFALRYVEIVSYNLLFGPVVGLVVGL